MSEEIVTKDQLRLLMDSHRDVIELNTKLLGKLDLVVSAQKESCEGISKLCDKLDQQTGTLTAANLHIHDKLVELRTEAIKDHSSIRNRLYVAFGMLGTITSALLATLYKILTILATI